VAFVNIYHAKNLTLDNLLKHFLATYPTILARHTDEEADKSDLLAAKLRVFWYHPQVLSEIKSLIAT
jgi:hypothetical protein